MQLMLQGELASWWWSISVGIWIAYVPRLILLKLPLNIPKTWIHCWIWGDGHHPSYDPFGRPFSAGYHPDLFKVAGTEIMPGYRAVLEGVQADQDFCKIILGLQYYYGKKSCCHYCGPGVIQWTFRNPPHGEPNDPNDLYTNFARDESRKNLSCFLL